MVETCSLTPSLLCGWNPLTHPFGCCVGETCSLTPLLCGWNLLTHAFVVVWLKPAHSPLCCVAETCSLTPLLLCGWNLLTHPFVAVWLKPAHSSVDGPGPKCVVCLWGRWVWSHWFYLWNVYVFSEHLLPFIARHQSLELSATTAREAMLALLSIAKAVEPASGETRLWATLPMAAIMIPTPCPTQRSTLPLALTATAAPHLCQPLSPTDQGQGPCPHPKRPVKGKSSGFEITKMPKCLVFMHNVCGSMWVHVCVWLLLLLRQCFIVYSAVLLWKSYKDHPQEKPLLWKSYKDHPQEKPLLWKSCKDHPQEKPLLWKSYKDHPQEKPLLWKSGLMTDYLMKAPPSDSTLVKDWHNNTPMRGHLVA